MVRWENWGMRGRWRPFTNLSFFLLKLFCSAREQSLVLLQRKGKSQSKCAMGMSAGWACKAVALRFYNLSPSWSLKYSSVFIPSQNLLISVTVGQPLLSSKWHSLLLCCLLLGGKLFALQNDCGTGFLESGLPVLFIVLSVRIFKCTSLFYLWTSLIAQWSTGSCGPLRGPLLTGVTSVRSSFIPPPGVWLLRMPGHWGCLSSQRTLEREPKTVGEVVPCPGSAPGAALGSSRRPDNLFIPGFPPG